MRQFELHPTVHGMILHIRLAVQRFKDSITCGMHINAQNHPARSIKRFLKPAFREILQKMNPGQENKSDI
jgi:hypothetical protein